jgi:restriction endonuclease
MGRMKDLQIDRMNLEEQFISFLADLFSAKNYQVVSQDHRGADLVIAAEQKPILVELKIHRSPQIARRSIQNALLQLSGFMRNAGAEEGILVVTQPLERDRIALPTGIALWDLHELIRQTRGLPRLAGELADLLKGLQVGAESLFEAVDQTAFKPAAEVLNHEVAEASPTAGAAIVERLNALEAGRPHASDFERACEDALELMFGTEFVGWRPQNEVDGGFHRMDLIARLVPTENPFWSTLATDFRTRYVIFEFKNYGDPISQDQIYTTEKYLFTSALRSVAIIVARNGISDSARKASRGSLREQGKLILCISMEQLCGMLRKRDGGGDPTDLLYEELDELLMTISR